MSGASVEVVLFKAADGDCILIRCLGDRDVFNILVDAGRPVAVANDGRTTATLPGPRQEALFELGRKWPLEEEPDRAERANGALAMGGGTELDVAALAAEPYNRDKTPRNGTSIAFVLQHGP